MKKQELETDSHRKMSSGSRAEPSFSQWILLGATFFIGVFSVVQALMKPYRFWLDYQEDFNLFYLQDSSIIWIVCFGILPFGFNSLFCFFFGIIYSRLRSASYLDFAAEKDGLRQQYPFNFGLLLPLAWWITFNLPNYYLAWQMMKEEPDLTIIKTISLFFTTHWPPVCYVNPLSLEFLLFYPMGNLAIIGGFALGVFYQEFPE